MKIFSYLTLTEETNSYKYASLISSIEKTIHLNLPVPINNQLLVFDSKLDLKNT